MSRSEAVIRKATDDEIDAFFAYEDRARLVSYAEVLVEDGMMLAMGTVVQHQDYRIVSLDISREAKPHAFKMIRALRRWLAENHGPVYAMVENDAFLTKLGFERTDLTLNGQELWRWQNLQQ